MKEKIDLNNLIRNELGLTNWVFLSDYVIFDRRKNTKFLIKPALLSYAHEIKNIILEYKEKYVKFKEITGIDIYPSEDYFNIADEEIIECIKFCCEHEFMPNILSESNTFLQIEYLNDKEWRKLTYYERSKDNYSRAVDSYCSHVKNLKFCVFIDVYETNQMIHRKTGKIKNIDINEIFPTTHLIPGLCNNFLNYQDIVINTNYTWKDERLNCSFNYYVNLCSIIKEIWGLTYNNKYIENDFDRLSKTLML